MKGIFIVIGFSLLYGLSQAQSYINIAFEQGVFVLVEGAYVGCGASFYDFDGDGWDDVTLCSPGNNIHCFRNNQGTLEPASFTISNSDEAKMPLWGDFDNDGDADLLITKSYAETRLYRNLGDMTFEDVTEELGLPMNPEMRTYGAAWGDYDRDGWNDLYICNYNFNGDVSNYLLKNHQGLSFTMVQDSLGVSNEVRPSFQPTFIDYNRDLNPDIYIINDKIHPNALYANNGDGTFSDVSEESGADLVIDAMSNAASDFDHDGDLDIYVTNATAGNKFLLNNGDGTFDEIAEAEGLEVFSICWGALWVDYDNDGWEDLHVLSTINGFAGNQNYFFLNDGGDFTDGLAVSGLIYDYHSSYSNAKGDLNNDGLPEILVNNEAPDYATLWLNTGGGGNWAKVELEGVVSNRDGIGAWLTWYVDGEARHKYTQCGQNYMGQNSQRHLMGLDTADQIDSLIVEWPSGVVDQFYDLSAGEVHALTEGSSLTASVTAPNGLWSCPGDSILLVAESWDNVVWNNGFEGDSLYVSEAGAYGFTGFNSLGIQVASDSMIYSHFDLPEVEALISAVSCYGESNGSIEFISDTDNGLSVIPGDSTQNATAWLPAGTYTYLLEDSNACSQLFDAVISQPDSLQAEIIATAAEPLWILDLEISGGSPPYLPLWNSGETSSSILAGEEGVYSCWISDANSCLTFASIELQAPVGLGEVSESTFRIFPNPASDQLSVETVQPGQLQILDALGSLVLEEGISGSTTLSIAKLSPGSYFLFWKEEGGTHHQRLVIK